MTIIEFIEFLLARIAEDEEVANRARPNEYLTSRDETDLTTVDDGHGYSTVGVTSGRVLAECEAKRQRIAHYQRISERNSENRMVHEEYILAEGAVRKQLMFDATVYADHPDYREEWKP